MSFQILVSGSLMSLLQVTLILKRQIGKGFIQDVMPSIKHFLSNQTGKLPERTEVPHMPRVLRVRYGR